MVAQIIDGKRIAGEIKAKDVVLSLSAIQAGDDPGTGVYVRAQQKSCEKIGIEYSLHQFKEDISQKELANFITRLNKNKRVSGIILQMPLPSHLNSRALQQMINPEKDAEGVFPANMGMLIYGRPILGPCTAMAVMEHKK